MAFEHVEGISYLELLHSLLQIDLSLSFKQIMYVSWANGALVMRLGALGIHIWIIRLLCTCLVTVPRAYRKVLTSKLRHRYASGTNIVLRLLCT